MKTQILICLFSAALLLSMQCQAGDINQPIHLPNKSVNKINQVRLQGLITEKEVGLRVDDELNATGLNQLEQFGCNLNIGNSVSGSSILSGERDVIITGDVINICE